MLVAAAAIYAGGTFLARQRRQQQARLQKQAKAEDIKITVIETNEDMLDKNNSYTDIHSLRSVLQKEKPNPFHPVILKAKNNGNSKSYILDRKLWIEPGDNFINNIKKISPHINVNILSPYLHEKGTTSQTKYNSQMVVDIPF